MPAKPLSDLQLRQAAEAYKRLGTSGNLLIKGLNIKAFDTRVRVAIDRGYCTREDRKTLAPDTPMPTEAQLRAACAPPPPPPVAVLSLDDLRSALGSRSATAAELAERFKVPPDRIEHAVRTLRAAGANIQEFAGVYSLQHTPSPKHQLGGTLPTYKSRPDGTYVFGFTSDNHLGSKYSRHDVLDSLYDHFAAQGVDRVFNAGNWIDGEARFNKHDLLVHGMDAQIAHLVQQYPRRKGLHTYAIAGDDHEGWYCQREGVDIGRYTEHLMRDAGRTDWHDLGFMEAFVRLEHAKSGEATMLHLMHPGGGSAYAVSYTVQKIVEGYDGGEKPAVLLAGHYHKLSYNLVRNVHAIQTGCTQDQTPFMRKKKIPAHVGGGICKLTQDGATGAIVACRVEFFNYFVADYYNNRWSHSGGVNLAPRV